MNNFEHYDLMFRSFPDCLTVKELQVMLQIKRTKAYELLKEKVIPSKKIGKDYKIAKIHVIKFLMEVSS